MHVKFGNYRITSDSRQYTLQEYKGTTLGEDGRERDRCDIYGYYGTLEELINALPDHVMRRSNGNLAEALEEMHQATEMLLRELING